MPSRVLRLLLASMAAAPLMEEITLMSRYDLEELKKIAKYLAGLPGYEECPRYERATKTPRAMLDKFKTYQAKQ